MAERQEAYAGGQRYLRISGLLWERIRHWQEKTREYHFGDDFPPGTEPIDNEQAEYDRLLSMRDAGDPRFSQPAAAQRFAELAARYGVPAPEPPTMPLG